MWLIMTIIFAVLTYLAVILSDSLTPAFLFLMGALTFAAITWHKYKNK